MSRVPRTSDLLGNDWHPSASLEVIRARAQLLSKIREFFHHYAVMEVETPVCSRFGNTDPNIESFITHFVGPGVAQGVELYLQTSPEYPMKRLLAAGSGPIYQICRVFRGGELGKRHNPEFTLLEWYRPGFDHHALMNEVARLVNSLLPQPLEVEWLSYQDAFQQRLGVDPHTATLDELRQCAVRNAVFGAEDLVMESVSEWLDLLLSHLIEPFLGIGKMTFVYDYPASQAALANIRDDNPAVAERFELYIDGVEIANGFHELTDATEQQQRFEQDNLIRVKHGQPPVAIDRNLLAALTQGMPDCAGVALGLDRLLMITVDVGDIRQVLAFPLERA